MTETKSANTIARERVDDLSARGSEPSWLRDQRLKAWEDYLKAPMPTSRDEHWRRTDFSGLDLNSLQTIDCGKLSANMKPPADKEKKSLEHVANPAGAVFQQTQGEGFAELSAQLQSKGVIFTDLRTALEKHPDLVRKFLSTTKQDDGKFTLMNRALFNCGLFLYVPANMEIAQPFISTIQLNSGGALFPRLLVVAGKNSKFSLVQLLESSSKNSKGAVFEPGSVPGPGTMPLAGRAVAGEAPAN